MSTRLPGERRDLRTRLTLGILRLYPHRWRSRYEAEMRAILEDHGARGRDLADLAWGAVRERLRGPNGPDPGAHPFLAAFWRGSILFLQRLALIVAVGTGMYFAGWTLGNALGPPPDMVGWFVVAMALALGMWGLRKNVQGMKWDSPLPIGRRLQLRRQGAWSMLGILAVGAAYLGWADETPPLTTVGSFALWLFYPWVDDALDFGGRHQRLRDASQQYFGHRERLKWAELELARLEALSYAIDHPDMIRQQREIDKHRADMVSAVQILRDPRRTRR